MGYIRILIIMEQVMPETVLITGASRGLGFWLAKSFLEQKAMVIALNKSKSEEFNNLALIHQKKIFELITDVSVELSVIKASEELKKITGHIDILINNAGIHPEPSAQKWKHITDLAD